MRSRSLLVTHFDRRCIGRVDNVDKYISPFGVDIKDSGIRARVLLARRFAKAQHMPARSSQPPIKSAKAEPSLALRLHLCRDMDWLCLRCLCDRRLCPQDRQPRARRMQALPRTRRDACQSPVFRLTARSSQLAERLWSLRFKSSLAVIEKNEAIHPGQFPAALAVYMEMVKSRRGEVSDMTLAVLNDLRVATLG
jgi:hypothetical protein